jgi:hypothetical protein
MSISNDLVMGFCKCHASLRRVALPVWDSSGVYAIGLTSFLGFDFRLVLDKLIHVGSIPLLVGVWWYLLIEGIKDWEWNQ